MMMLLSGLLAQLTGPLLKWVTVPLLRLAALTFAKVAWDKRDARIMLAGEQVCDARWRAGVRAQEKADADRAVSAVNQILTNERNTMEVMRDSIQLQSEEINRLRLASAAAPAAGGPNCLSDSVLDALRKRQGSGSGGQPKPATKTRGPAS